MRRARDLTELRLLDVPGRWAIERCRSRACKGSHHQTPSLPRNPSPQVKVRQKPAQTSKAESWRAKRAPIVTPKRTRRSPRPEPQSVGVGGFTALSSCSSHMPMTCGYVLRGGIWDRRRPLCVRGRRVPGSERSTDRGLTGHGRARTSPRTPTDQPTDGGGEGHGRGRWERYADRSRPDSRSDLPFQDACSASPSPSSPGSSSASGMPRASAMRWLAAVAWPSMQWA